MDSLIHLEQRNEPFNVLVRGHMSLDGSEVDVTLMAVDALEFRDLGTELLMDAYFQWIKGVSEDSILQ